MTRRLVLIALGAAGVAALFATIGLTVSGDEPQRTSMSDPLGIAPEDATRIVDPEKRAMWANEYVAKQTAVAIPDPRLSRTPGVADPLRPTGVDPTEVPLRAGIVPNVNSFMGWVFRNGYHDYAAGENRRVYAAHTATTTRVV
jgi:hypothetical protein